MPRTWRICRLALIGCILTAPMLLMPFTAPGDEISRNELRHLAPMPGLPRSLRDWTSLPRRLTAYFNDHFGLREELTHARAQLVHLWLETGDEQVFVTRDRMFLRTNHAIQQSAGVLVRREQLEKTADLIARVHAILTTRGIGFMYSLAPNGATIEVADLPGWARNPGRATEYDLLLDLLRARGVPTVDLRPALRNANLSASVYFRYDSHWNARGAVTGFNVVARANDHLDWSADPATVLTPPEPLVGGDLARLLGVQRDVVAPEPNAAFPPHPVVTLAPETVEQVNTGREGPRILILGDSFTRGLFTQLVARDAGTVFWVAHRTCGFDWSWIDRLHPDEVWWIPTERFAPCQLPPANMPG
jgi:alginate O-acetyltransferase complex protein AlgJ